MDCCVLVDDAMVALQYDYATAALYHYFGHSPKALVHCTGQTGLAQPLVALAAQLLDRVRGRAADMTDLELEAVVRAEAEAETEAESEAEVEAAGVQDVQDL